MIASINRGAKKHNTRVIKDRERLCYRNWAVIVDCTPLYVETVERTLKN